MKKYLVLTAAALAVTAQVAFAAKVITTVKSDPDPQTGLYKGVGEVHDGDNHTLSCHNPGSKECKWQTSPWLVSVTVEQVDFDVERQVMSGVFDGSIDYGEGVRVRWAAESVTNYTYTIQAD